VAGYQRLGVDGVVYIGGVCISTMLDLTYILLSQKQVSASSR